MQSDRTVTTSTGKTLHKWATDVQETKVYKKQNL